MSSANPWLGLGARPAPRPPRQQTPRTGSNASSSGAVEAFARPSVQRIVPAAGLPLPVSLPVSLPAINTTPPPTQAPTEEAPAMASQPPATTPSVTPTPTGLQHSTRVYGEARRLMLTHIAKAKPQGLTRTELQARLAWDRKRTTDNLKHVELAGLVRRDRASDDRQWRFFITKEGLDRLAETGAAPPAGTSPTGLAARRTTAARTPAPARTKAPAAKKVVNVPQHDAAQATAARGRAVQAAGMLARVMQATGTLARPAVAQQASADSTVVVQIAPTFRAAVYTDGSFHLSKAVQSIELTATEHAQLLRYLERMAEAPDSTPV